LDWSDSDVQVRGLPTPTLTWYKPDGNKLNKVTVKESTVKMTTTDDQDFGEYKCVAYNGLDPLNDALLTRAQIRMCQLNFKVFGKIFVTRDNKEIPK